MPAFTVTVLWGLDGVVVAALLLSVCAAVAWMRSRGQRPGVPIMAGARQRRGVDQAGKQKHKVVAVRSGDKAMGRRTVAEAPLETRLCNGDGDGAGGRRTVAVTAAPIYGSREVERRTVTEMVVVVADPRNGGGPGSGRIVAQAAAAAAHQSIGNVAGVRRTVVRAAAASHQSNGDRADGRRTAADAAAAAHQSNGDREEGRRAMALTAAVADPHTGDRASAGSVMVEAAATAPSFPASGFLTPISGPTNGHEVRISRILQPLPSR